MLHYATVEIEMSQYMNEGDEKIMNKNHVILADDQEKAFKKVDKFYEDNRIIDINFFEYIE